MQFMFCTTYFNIFMDGQDLSPEGSECHRQRHEGDLPVHAQNPRTHHISGAYEPTVPWSFARALGRARTVSAATRMHGRPRETPTLQPSRYDGARSRSSKCPAPVSTTGGRQAPQEEEEEEEVEEVGEGGWVKPRLGVAPPVGCRGTPGPGSSADEAAFSHGWLRHSEALARLAGS